MTSQKLLRTASAAVLLVAILTGCGGDDEPTVSPGGSGAASTTTAGAQATATDKVAVKDFAYSPETASVKAGTTVTWTFQDDVDHNVEPVGGAEPTASPDLKGGKTYTFTFEKAGTFKYRCGIHNSMTGSVVVA